MIAQAQVVEAGIPATWLLIVVFIGVLAFAGLATLIGVIIAITKKRPGLALATVGIVPLLGIAAVFGSLIVWRSEAHHRVHLGDTSEVVHLSDMPMGSHPPMPVEGMSNSNWGFHVGFSRIKLLIICVVAAVIAVAVAAKGKQREPGQAPRRGLPVLLLIPIIALPLLVAGSFVGYRSVGPVPGVNHFDHSLQNNFPFDDAGRAHARAAEQLQREVMRAAEARRSAAQAQAEQSRRESMRLISATSAQLQRQFMTMDFNELIEQYNRPKIELAADTTAASIPPAPSPPAVAVSAPEPPAAAVAVASAETEASIVAVETESFEEPVNPAAADAEKTSSGEAQPNVDADQSETSIAPPELGKPETKPLPSWVNDQPGMVGQDWREVVVTDEYATADECRRAMDIYLMLKTAERIQTLAGHPYVDHSRPSLTFDRDMILSDGKVLVVRGVPTYSNDDRLQLLRKMGLGIDEIRRSVVREEHLAARDSRRAFDTMYKKYTLAQFTPWFDTQLRRHYDAFLRQERFEIVGGWAGSVLGLLGLVFGLLKVDTWTKGYYSKRLFIGVPAVIISGLTLWSLI